MTTSNEFFAALQKLQQQGQRIALPEDLVIKGFLDTSESFSFSEATPEIEERALGTAKYLVCYPNKVSNGSFETDLTGWGETISGNHTATTAQVTSVSATKYGSLGSLEIDVTASTGAGSTARFQDISVSPGQTWSLEAQFKGDAFSGAVARFRAQWRDVGGGGLGSDIVTSTDTSGDFVQLKHDGLTAPAGAATLRVILEVMTSGSGQTGKCYFDLVRAELGASAISDRAKRMIAGECVCRS